MAMLLLYFIILLGVLFSIALSLSEHASRRRLNRLKELQPRIEQAKRERRMSIEIFFENHPKYVQTLRQIAERTIYRDEFGDLVKVEWQRKLKEFVIQKLHPELGIAPEVKGAPSTSVDLVPEVEQVLRGIWKAAPAPAVSTSRDGDAFEKQCGVVFRKSGFETQHSGRSGDQGADLIARKGNLTVVVQCKCYQGPVGNSAVQEVAAARKFFDANRAIVVAERGFTRSARQLAHKLDVHLVSYKSLRQFLTSKGLDI
jgi:restriction system protein